jgi:hypothetical protein
MAKIAFTRESSYGEPLDNERHQLLLFRGELREQSERYLGAKYIVPLIDRRLREIQAERNHLGLPDSDPLVYAEKERDYEMEIDSQRG